MCIIDQRKVLIYLVCCLVLMITPACSVQLKESSDISGSFRGEKLGSAPKTLKSFHTNTHNTKVSETQKKVIQSKNSKDINYSNLIKQARLLTPLMEQSHKNSTSELIQSVSALNNLTKQEKLNNQKIKELKTKINSYDLRPNNLNENKNLKKTMQIT